MPNTPKYITLADPTNTNQPRHMAYYECGETANRDVIVCVHGLSRNSLDFGPLAEALTGKYRVICPDVAGRGNSDWLTNKSDYNYVTYVTDAAVMLKQLGLEKVTWIGTSMGGIIGMMLAAHNPGLITRLVLNDIGAVISAEGLNRIIGYVGSSGIFANEADALAYLKSIMAPFGIASEEEWRYMLKISFNLLPNGTYALRYDPDISKPLREAAADKDKPVTDVDLTEFWNKITCPTLILRGTRSDILSEKTATDMRASRPNVSLVELEGVGHAPALLNASQIALITNWLDIRH